MQIHSTPHTIHQRKQYSSHQARGCTVPLKVPGNKREPGLAGPENLDTASVSVIERGDKPNLSKPAKYCEVWFAGVQEKKKKTDIRKESGENRTGQFRDLSTGQP